MMSAGLALEADHSCLQRCREVKGGCATEYQWWAGPDATKGHLRSAARHSLAPR